jgi:L-asparagine oxygenase
MLRTRIESLELLLLTNEITILKDISSKITHCPSEEPELFCRKLKELNVLVPERIKKILYEFGLNGSENGFLIIKNIEIVDQELPKTPSGNQYKIGERTFLAKIQALFMSIISEMIAYEAEGYGSLFQDVVPMKEMSSIQTSVGSNTELEIHTEQAFSNLRPDILSLACLRGDKDAFTYILPVNKIIQNLSKDEINLLYKPLWKTGVDLSFKLNGHDFVEGDIRGPFSILNGSTEDPYLIFDQDLMKGITEESHEMIEKIVTIYYNERLVYNLKPGEIILIDNKRAVHGRSAFFPRYDGYDRFLIRCFGTFDYEKSLYARCNNSRMVRAIYS